MKKSMILVALAIAVMSFGAFPGTDTITVAYEVTAINVISISADEVDLLIGTAVAGSPPTTATDATTATYSFTTNDPDAGGIIIKGSIDVNMPAGLTLKLALEQPAGAVALPAAAMSTTAANLVTGIDASAQGPLTMTFTLEATVAAAVVYLTKTLTLTIEEA